MQAVRQVGLCGLCDSPLTPAEKALQLAYCDDCACGRERAKPETVEAKPSRLAMILFAAFVAAIPVAYMVLGHLLGVGA